MGPALVPEILAAFFGALPVPSGRPKKHPNCIEKVAKGFKNVPNRPRPSARNFDCFFSGHYLCPRETPGRDPKKDIAQRGRLDGETFRGFGGSQDVTGSAVMMSWERKRDFSGAALQTRSIGIAKRKHR